MNKSITDPAYLSQYLGGMEATNLMLLGMVGKINQRMIQAGIVDQAWLEASVEELANSIQNTRNLSENPEVKRRLPILKSMMINGSDEKLDAADE